MAIIKPSWLVVLVILCSLLIETHAHKHHKHHYKSKKKHNHAAKRTLHAETSPAESDLFVKSIVMSSIEGTTSKNCKDNPYCYWDRKKSKTERGQNSNSGINTRSEISEDVEKRAGGKAATPAKEPAPITEKDLPKDIAAVGKLFGGTVDAAKKTVTVKKCPIVVKAAAGFVKLELSDPKCKDTMSLSEMFKIIFKKELKTNKIFVPAENHNVDSIEIDSKKGNLTFVASQKEPFSLIEGSDLKAKGSQLVLSFMVKDQFKFSSLVVEDSGSVALGKSNIAYVLSKKEGEEMATYSLTTIGQSLTIADLMKSFDADGLDGEKDEKTGKPKDDPAIIVLNTITALHEIECVGKVSGDGQAWFRFSGVLKKDPKFGDSKVIVTAQNEMEKVNDIPDYQIAVGAVISLTKVDLNMNKELAKALIGGSDPYFFKDLEFLSKSAGKNLYVEFSTRDFTPIADGVLDIVTVAKESGILNKGFKVKIPFNLKAIAKEVGGKPDASAKDESYINLLFLNKKVSIELADIDLITLMLVLMPNVDKDLIGKMFPVTPTVTVTEFTTDVLSSTYALTLKTSKPVVVGNYIMTIDNVGISLQRKDGNWNFVLSATKKIGAGTMDVVLMKNASRYELKGTIDTLSVDDMKKEFNLTGAPMDKLKKEINVNLALKNVIVTAIFGSYDQDPKKMGEYLQLDLQIHGQISVPALEDPEDDTKTIQFEGRVQDVPDFQDKTKFIRVMGFGIVFTNMNFAKTTTVIFNGREIKTVQTSLLEKCDIVVLVQNGDATRGKAVGSIPWTLQELVDAGGTDDNKKEGLQFSIQTTIPKECNATEKFCTFLLKHIGEGKTLRLNGELTPTGASLRFDLGDLNIKLSEKFVFQKASIILTWIFPTAKSKPDGAFEIEGTMDYAFPALNKKSKPKKRTEIAGKRTDIVAATPDSVPVPDEMLGDNEAREPDVADPITMIAKIKVSLSGDLKLTLQVNREKGYNPFKTKSITFTEFAFKVGFNWYTMLPNFEVNGEVFIGDPSVPMDQRIKLIFAGGGSSNPKDFSFFAYADTNAPITLNAFLKSYKVADKIPAFLKDTGFPRGFEFSIALPEGTSVTEVHGLELPAGVMFKGDINLLGMEMSVDFQVNLPKYFRFNATIKEPLYFKGGAFQLSNWDETAGPNVYLALTPQDKVNKFKFKMSARMSFLGMAVGALIDIDERHMAVTVDLKFLNIIEASVELKTIYDPKLGLQKGVQGWRVTACLKILASVEEEIEKDTEDTFKEAETISVNTAKSFQENPKYLLYKKKINALQGEMEAQEKEVEELEKEFLELKNGLDKKCIAQCEKTKVKRKKLVFKIAKGFKTTDVGDEEVTDPKCIASCKDAVAAKKKDLKLAKSKASEFNEKMKKYEGRIHLHQHLFNLQNTFAEIQKKFDQFKEDLKKVVEEGKKLMNNAIKNVRGLFSLDAACLSNELQLGNARFKFSAYGNYTFKKEKKNFDFTIVLDPGQLIRQMAVRISEIVFPIIKKTKETFGMIRSTSNELNDDMEKQTLTSLLTSIKRDDITKPFAFSSDSFKRHFNSDNTRAEDLYKSLHRRVKKAYGLLPRKVVLRDDDTMRLFRDIYDPDESVSDDFEDNSAQRSFGDLELGTDDKATQCRRAHQVMNVYKGVYEMLDNIDTKNKASRDEVQEFIDKTKADYDDFEQSTIRNAKLNGYSDERIESTMFFIDKMKDGVKNWQKQLDRDSARADKISLKSWKKGVSDYFGKLNIDPVTFVKTMEDLTKDASKRWKIPESESRIIDSISIASQKLGELLESGDDASFTDKRETIDSLGTHVNVMKNSVGSFSCDG